MIETTSFITADPLAFHALKSVISCPHFSPVQDVDAVINADRHLTSLEPLYKVHNLYQTNSLASKLVSKQ